MPLDEVVQTVSRRCEAPPTQDEGGVSLGAAEHGVERGFPRDHALSFPAASAGERHFSV